MLVVIYQNPNPPGNVCVVAPGDGYTAADILLTDLPAGVTGYIVDDSTLPQSDFDFFNAWQMTVTNGVPAVATNISAAVPIAQARILAQAAATAQQRQINSAIGVAVGPSVLLTAINAAKAAAAAATTTAQLRAAIAQVPTS